MQAGRQSPGFDGGVFTPVQDVPTHQFHRWVANSYLAAIDAADSS
jgi:choline monooxygenase